jgi:flagellar motor switch protein FliN/FliY
MTGAGTVSRNRKVLCRKTGERPRQRLTSEWNPMADDSDKINQDKIEELLRNAGSGEAPASEGGAESESDAGGQIDQSDIEALLAGQAGGAPSAEPDDDDIGTIDQSDIEALLASQAASAPPAAAAAPQATSAPAAAAAAVSPPAAGSSGFSEPRSDIELLLDQASAALHSIDHPAGDMPHGAHAFNLPTFKGEDASTEKATLDLIRDVDLDLRIELGRTHMYLEEVLKLKRGAVVPLDKLAGDPVDIYVNGRIIARGEVLVLNDNFCVRVAELIAGQSSE